MIDEILRIRRRRSELNRDLIYLRKVKASPEFLQPLMDELQKLADQEDQLIPPREEAIA